MMVLVCVVLLYIPFSGQERRILYKGKFDEGKTPDSVSRRGDRLGVVIVDFDCWKNVNQCL